ncbi:MAG: isoaspartyl peptidase/L-asparaginase [Anaerolineae bacterium]|nr:isoaspartyl peptidase/L-asparaginase [Anaerolineae bacterium]
MIVLASSTAAAGMETTVKMLKDGGSALDAVEVGIRLVEVAPDVHSVGQDAWPNLLGQHELDASIMDGRTLNAGAVGALHGFIYPISVARRVMADLPHALLVGDGAARFADEIGAERGDLMTDEVREKWAEWIQERTSPHEWATWPADKLAPWARLTADPETAHGTVCLLARDRRGNIACGVSTSGWGWKYPGRLGDSPIIGAGNYADDRYGAAACTGFGEMTIRTGTARGVTLYLKMGLSIQEAVSAAAQDLHDAMWQYKGRVTIYAFDRDEQHHVLTYSRAGDRQSDYWLWSDGMATPEKRQAPTIEAAQ